LLESPCLKAAAAEWALRRDPTLGLVGDALRRRHGDPAARIDPAQVQQLVGGDPWPPSGGHAATDPTYQRATRRCRCRRGAEAEVSHWTSGSGRGVGASGATPTMGVVESRTDGRSTSRLAHRAARTTWPHRGIGAAASCAYGGMFVASSLALLAGVSPGHAARHPLAGLGNPRRGPRTGGPRGRVTRRRGLWAAVMRRQRLRPRLSLAAG
jgi:hypothetical protein